MDLHFYTVSEIERINDDLNEEDMLSLHCDPSLDSFEQCTELARALQASAQSESTPNLNKLIWNIDVSVSDKNDPDAYFCLNPDQIKVLITELQTLDLDDVRERGFPLAGFLKSKALAKFLTAFCDLLQKVPEGYWVTCHVY